MQDSTITDRPMVDMLAMLAGLLDKARAQAPSRRAASSPRLHQLVLIVADGRFHERDALRAALVVRTPRPGLCSAGACAVSLRSLPCDCCMPGQASLPRRGCEAVWPESAQERASAVRCQGLQHAWLALSSAGPA